jgi:cysteinyl-tRNA synthetase
MSNLQIYNTLAREKTTFRPIEPGKVRMYVCGMTVYDYCHVGHARMMMVFDIVYRWLKASGFNVTYVRNITDIDDKIIARAVENGESISQLTSRFIQYMHEDIEALGILPPDHEPRATDYVPQMLGIIEKLEKNGLAYKATDGDVNFSVRDFDGYGKLSGKSLDDLRAGERVDVNTGKRDPLDFVLWKASKEAEPKEVKWSSKWGSGRPGWHIECSAMSSALLGEQFDIHGGGADLQFPHHENEIAQSEGACQHTFVNYWMHNGFVRVDDEKMSKSLGNFFTIREVLKQYDAEVVRFFIIRAHYRSPLNYSDAHLDDARAALRRLYTALGIGQNWLINCGGKVQATTLDKLDRKDGLVDMFIEAMNDDFNTTMAISELFTLASDVNIMVQQLQQPNLPKEFYPFTEEALRHKVQALVSLGGVLGLLQRDPQAFLQGGVDIDDALVAEMIEARKQAKLTKNFAEADRIRDELLAKGIVLEDKTGGITEWRRA